MCQRKCVLLGQVPGDKSDVQVRVFVGFDAMQHCSNICKKNHSSIRSLTSKICCSNWCHPRAGQDVRTDKGT